MTKEQALKDMQERCRICKRDALPTEKECEKCYFPVAIDCIEKQIPMRTIDEYIQTNIGTRLVSSMCPVCKAHLIVTVREQQKYCDCCGQAIDWSDKYDKD